MPLTEQFHNLVDLVNVGLAREERIATHDLGEETADGPDVDGPAVAGVTHQQLRGAIPARRYVVRVCLTTRGHEASEPKVAQLDHTLVGHQDVLRLDVSVHDLARQVALSSRHLQFNHYGSDSWLRLHFAQENECSVSHERQN